MFSIYRLWRQVFLPPKPRKMSSATHIAGGASSESLEDRRLLSAVMTSGVEAPVVAEIEPIANESATRNDKDTTRSTPRKKVVPNIAGTWTYTVFSGGTPIVGQLELTQKGKKVNGTLTREFQPPGDLKGKVKVERARAPGDEVPRSDLPNFARALLIGNILDVSLDSGRIGFAFTLLFSIQAPEGVYDRMEGSLKGPDGDVTVTLTRNTV